MLKWFRRKQPKVEFWPEHSRIKGVKPTERDALMSEMIGGYEKHEALFRLLMIELRYREGDLCMPCNAKTEAESFQWVENQKRLVAEVGMLRWVVRLPIMAERMKSEGADDKSQEPEENPYD